MFIRPKMFCEKFFTINLLYSFFLKPLMVKAGFFKILMVYMAQTFNII